MAISVFLTYSSLTYSIDGRQMAGQSQADGTDPTDLGLSTSRRPAAFREVYCCQAMARHTYCGKTSLRIIFVRTKVARYKQVNRLAT
jgi:hypothetical protein